MFRLPRRRCSPGSYRPSGSERPSLPSDLRICTRDRPQRSPGRTDHLAGDPGARRDGDLSVRPARCSPVLHTRGCRHHCTLAAGTRHVEATGTHHPVSERAGNRRRQIVRDGDPFEGPTDLRAERSNRLPVLRLQVRQPIVEQPSFCHDPLESVHRHAKASWHADAFDPGKQARTSLTGKGRSGRHRRSQSARRLPPA